MTQLLFQPLDDKVEFASLEKSEQAMVQFFRDNAAVDIDYKRLSKMALVYMSDTLQKWKQEADRLSQTSCRAPRFHPSEDNDGVCRRLSKSHFPFDRRLIDIPELDDSIAHIESEAALEAVLSGDSAHEDLLELTAARTHGSSTSQHASSSSTLVASAEKSTMFSASLTGLQKISMSQQHQRAGQSLPHLLQVPKKSIKQSNYKSLLKPERCEIHTREELLDYVRMPHRGPVGEKVAPVMFVKIHKLDSTEILQATASAWIDSIVRVQCWDHDALQYIYRVFLHIDLEPSILAGYVYGCRIAMSDFHGMLSYYWINRYMFSPKPMDPSGLVPASELPRIPTLFQLDKSNYEISCHPNVRYGVKIKGNRVYLQIMSLADFRFASSAHMLDRFSRAHNDNLIKLFRLIPDKKSFDIAVQVTLFIFRQKMNITHLGSPDSIRSA